MRWITAAALVWVVPAIVWAAANDDMQLDPVDVSLNDKPSLQRGAHIFINYCLSCHSAGYMRYNRMGKDLGVSDKLLKENLLFAAERPGDLMEAVMPAEDAMAAFNTIPADLTLVARSRGPEWIYTYLRSFYRDSDSPSGWNNIVFPNVAMPHVLYEWQGHQRAMFTTEPDGSPRFEGFELERPGTMTEEEYNTAMRDLTNFLVYLGEPAKLVRHRLGAVVLGFLSLFLVAVYLLKQEYWKDVH